MPFLAQNIVLLIFGIVVIFYGADWLVRGSVRLAAAWGVPPIVVGLTVVSLGTSAPELAVALLAAFRGAPDIALGNVMGSNLANIGLVLGLTAMIRPLEVAARVVSRELPVMLLITAALFPFILDGVISRTDGLLLLVILGLYLLFVFRSAAGEPPEIQNEYNRFAEKEKHLEVKTRWRDVGLVLVGSLALLVGGRAVVGSAEYVAEVVGIPPLLISLSVIAVGTSLPELATSLVAALRDECDIAVGNLVGSNIFNIAAILGITGAVRPLEVHPNVIMYQLPAVLLLSAIFLPIARLDLKIKRWEGAVLVLSYLALMSWLFYEGLM